MAFLILNHFLLSHSLATILELILKERTKRVLWMMSCQFSTDQNYQLTISGMSFIHTTLGSAHHHLNELHGNSNIQETRPRSVNLSFSQSPTFKFVPFLFNSSFDSLIKGYTCKFTLCEYREFHNDPEIL